MVRNAVGFDEGVFESDYCEKTVNVVFRDQIFPPNRDSPSLYQILRLAVA